MKELLPDEPLTKKLITKGFWLYFFSFLIAPLGYITKILISSDLHVEEVGVLYSIISLIGLISSYNDLGMTESLNHFIPKFIVAKRMDKVKSILIYAFLAQMITGILIALFFYFGSHWLALHYFKTETANNVLKMFAFYFLGYNFFQTITTFFIAIQKVLYRKLIDFARMLTITLMIIFFFFTHTGSLQNYSLSWIIGLYGAISLALFFFFKYFYKDFLQKEKILRNIPLFKKIGRYALMVLAGTSAGTILGQIDMQMVLYLLGADSAGYYTNYLSILGISGIVIGPIFGLLFPVFSELYAKKDTTKILLLKEILVNNFIIIAIAFSVFFFVFAKPIALVLFGSKFLFSGSILRYSIIFLVFNLLFGINFSILAGIGKVKERVKIIFVSVIFNFIMNYFLIQWIGVYGAALATGIGWVLMRILGERFLGKEYHSKIYWRQIGINLLFFIILGIFLAQYVFPVFSWTHRRTSLRYLFIIFFIYFGFFIGINYGKIRRLVLEVKKMK